VSSRSRVAAAGLWRHHDFRRLWIGETTSQVGSAITGVALPLVAVSTLHSGAFLVALLAASTWLPWLVLGLPVGALVDRVARRPVMLAADAVALAAFASVPVAAWLGAISIAQLVVVAAVAGSAAVFFNTAYTAFLPKLVAEDDLIEANAKLIGSESAAKFCGPGIGGAIAQAAGPATGLLADAASFAVSFWCLLGLRGREPRESYEPRARAPLRREVAAGLRFVRADPFMRVDAIEAGLANLFLTAVDALLVVFLVRDVHLSAGGVGLVMAIASLGGVVGAALARPLARAVGSARALLVCALAGLPFGLLLPLARPGAGVLFAVAGQLPVVVGVVASNVIVGSFMQTYVPAEMLARVSAAIRTIAFSAMPAGALLAGALAAALGLRPALWILSAGLALVGGVFVASPVRRLRELPRRPQPAAAAAEGAEAEADRAA